MKLTRLGKVALLSLALSVATVGWWAHSRTSVDSVRAGSIDLWASDGHLSFTKAPTATDASLLFAVSSRPKAQPHALPLFSYKSAGYDAAAKKWTPGHLVFPVWVLTALLALPPVLWMTSGGKRKGKEKKPAYD